MDDLLSDAEVETLFRRLAGAFPGRSERPGELPDSVKDVRDPFRACVSCLLSAQSLDRNTAAAANALFALARTPEEVLALDDERLLAAIRPAGLYNMKARNLRRLCTALIEEHGGTVPRTREGLMGLPGIGRKCADIVLHFTFDEAVCAVDTHIFRLSNRIGLARGKTEAQVARQLEPRIPSWAAWDAHLRLLAFGKRVCTARAPRCRECPVSDLCRAFQRGEITPRG